MGILLLKFIEYSNFFDSLTYNLMNYKDKLIDNEREGEYEKNTMV